ncbi:MAG: C4-dicarboxylate ABC transporter [Altererythrobacter sp. XM-24bin4]|uniref:SLC13 family permease n=1 Tax=uncultured Altererythrobacter sp. TaxID=500840 RepID=UPI000D7B440D|nr:DASS family sodium-coupled anion symporter [uncultured Altererythrobacter sp.]PWL24923.1 MAG: C4-dicarboxylate ABC transporter [Altererythrobacter sp. XM-24bin4]
MTASAIGRILGPFAFAITVFITPPAGMPAEAWLVAGLVVWMAAWWMTEAVPLTVTALLPFVILPFGSVSSARDVASTYYSPILFLLLGGAFLALAIERTGLHKRLSLAILRAVGSGGGQTQLLLAFMISAALLSMLISNTSTTLIMMPMALAVLSGGMVARAPTQPTSRDAAAVVDKEGLSGALPMGIAFAASIGGLGTLVGSPTNAIAVGLLDSMIGVQITFIEWTLFGLPIVLVGVPLATFIIARFQRVAEHPFDVAAASQAIDTHAAWTSAEKRLIPIVALAFLAWMTVPWVGPLLPDGSWTNGTIAIIASFALFLVPDGTGRPLLIWKEADRAPWAVIMMFGGGLALAAGMQVSGLATWLAEALLPLETLSLIVVALAVVAMIVVITEFASNVATATGIIPVVASLVVALGADPLLLAMPAALAASWGFMLPAGTGPNAIAWSTGRIKIERMVGAGLVLDVLGVFLIVGVVWGVAALI